MTSTPSTTPPTIKRRKKASPVPPPKINPKIMQIVDLYTKGVPVPEIAKKVGWIEKSVRRELNKFYASLRDLMETEALIKSQSADNLSGLAKSNQQMTLYRSQEKIDKDINKDFIPLLSSDNDPVLSQEESLFCYLLVHEGDEVKALQDAGLSVGLTKSSSGYRRAMKLRILMLKGKRNIIKFVSDLQISYAKDLNVGKEMIQTELLQQIRQLKALNEPKYAPTIAKLIDSLGRTVGAFTDKIQIEEVSFDDAMDKMLEMRKADGHVVTSHTGFDNSPKVPGSRIADDTNLTSNRTSETFVFDRDLIG